jgi:hypothetical protein
MNEYIVYGEKKIFYTIGRLEQPRQDKNLLYRHKEPNEPTKEGPLSFLLFESLFASVSTVSRGHPSLVSLVHSSCSLSSCSRPSTSLPCSQSFPAQCTTCTDRCPASPALFTTSPVFVTVTPARSTT